MSQALAVRTRPLLAARARAARHPHLALLVAVCGALATEPAVQAGRDASSTIEYVGAAAGLVGRATIALVCLFVAWEGQRRLRLGPVLACALLLGGGWIALHFLIGVEPDLDLTFYSEDGAALLDGRYPLSEYPTGAVALFAAETWLGGEPPRALHAVVMVGFQLATVAAIWSVRTRWSPWLAAFVAVWPMSLFHWEFRYDLAPTAFLAVGLALAYRERWALSGVALGVGAALKWSPAVAFVALAAWLLARRFGGAAIAHTTGFAISLVVLTVPFLVWQPSNVLDAYQFQGDRGLTGESVWYLLLAPVGLAPLPGHLSEDAGASDSVNVVVTVAQAVFVLALVLMATRMRHRPQAVALAALTPAAFLLTNRVFSSQFLLLLVAVWALAAALVVVSERQQLAVGLLMAGATFGNALVHPYTVKFAWELASALLFALAIALTVWLVKVAREPMAAAQLP